MLHTDSRYGKTRKKNITLTRAGHAKLNTYAKAHQMSFSAAIETLALVGMDADLSTLLVPVLRDVVDKALQRNFNRMAKLGLLAAAESAMAHDLATMLMLQMVRREAVAHPQDFENRLGVGYGADDTLDGRIRQVYDEIRDMAKKRQQRVLKEPLTEIFGRLQTDEREVDHG